MRLKIWKGEHMDAKYLVPTLIISILILNNFATEYKLPLLIFLAFQIIYMLKKGVIWGGRTILLKTRSTLAFFVPSMILIQEFGFYTFETRRQL